MKYQQPWIAEKWTEIIFILLPPFVSLLLIFCFPAVFADANSMPDHWWVALILLIDVAHVYSTLYRTYLDTKTYREQKNRLFVIPFLAFIAGVFVYSYDPLVFWRILAYIAVFHFIRQQYGFMRIYSRSETNRFSKIVDTTTIYAATIYPMIYWHFSPGRNFNWFVDGEFLQGSNNKLVLTVSGSLFLLIVILYMVKEILNTIKTGHFNLPRNAVIIGTIISWYFGIVYFNGDMAFTVLNVVSHGIPYMALVWMYGKKQYGQKEIRASRFLKITFSKYGIVLFLGLIFLLAYMEEGLWDVTVWKEHTSVFKIFHIISAKFSDTVLALLVPLLVLPQLTHYIIDGYIWKIRKKHLDWKGENL